MSKIFLDKDNNVVYEGYETHEVVANPTLAGTEDNLTGLKIGDTKYKVSSGDNYMLKVNLTYSSSAGEYITDYTLQEICNAASSGKLVYIYCVNYSNQYGQNTTFNIIKDATVTIDPHGEADAIYSFNLVYAVNEDDPDDAGIIFDYDNQKFTYFYTPVN